MIGANRVGRLVGVETGDDQGQAVKAVSRGNSSHRRDVLATFLWSEFDQGVGLNK
jgi:hypothetical protein